MKLVLAFSSFALLASTVPVSAGDAYVDALTQASRAAIMTFGKLLKGELKSAIEAGGPVNAIEVCNLKAHDIAEALSADKGFDLARRSLKYRNPDNKPNEWERDVLNQFEQRKASGEETSSLEYTEVVSNGDREEFRYMKAIPTGEVCLACHGESLTPVVRGKLDQLYPGDKARGFAAGDIRGAFRVVKPL